MKSLNQSPEASSHARLQPRGFALIVTLSLMILLTVIAVGLLTLSSVSLRSSSQADAMNVARANARLALLIALGDLQKLLGPDTRISATADQIPSSDPATSATPPAQRNWAGAYKSWPAALPNAARPTPEFLQWFVSGDPAKAKMKSFAGSALPATAKDSVEIVSAKFLGPNADPVRVPLMTQTSPNGVKTSCAWWVSDLGTKALIGPAKPIPTTLAETRADQQSAPAFNLSAATAGPAKPFEMIDNTNPLLANIVSFQTGALVATPPASARGLFHDFTAQSRGLLTNVRQGGFRKDLSMELERPAASQPTMADSNILYKVAGEPGINLQELWAYYHLASSSNTRGIRRTGAATFTTGGAMASGTPHLQIEPPANATTDDSFYFKQPVIVSYQLALSFQARIHESVNRLHLVADPIITFWNPLDVPVVVPAGTVFTVKYWQVPYNLSISKNSGPFEIYPMAAALSNTNAGANGDGNFMSIEVGRLQQLAFKPGEVVKMSQVGSAIARSSIPVIHKVAGGKGFNFGGGVAIPLRTRANTYIDLLPSDIINFRASANGLTSGATTTSGQSNAGGTLHTRHFSLTHHEYYVGEDRGSSANSLGIGGIFIDWDFGNRRLVPTGDRGAVAPGMAGTKPALERLYADRHTNIFKPIAGRPLPVSSLTAKQPFMLLSFSAKTETGSTLGTRSLSRFNPKALHVDFYDLSAKERDMLPYEYTVDQLNSWINNKLEQSPGGNAFFGGGTDAASGTSFVTTHSVPREPVISLAAFQHSFANGFNSPRPKYGYGTLNAREPLLPQISHAIGNSYASPLIAKDKTEGLLPGARPMADHSYLANQALWDDWFLSGITPQTLATYSKARSQKEVATDFFSGTGKLPVARYLPNSGSQTPAKIANTYFSSTTPSAAATQMMASLMQVDGLFNVNSTSVGAWKSLLGALKARPSVVRDAVGRESVNAADAAASAVSGLLAPVNAVASGSGNFDLNSPAQWIGRRTLNDTEIDRLARAIVREVRKRGPFLSLADFVNRRVGSDEALARSGAIQSALDSSESQINESYQTGGRSTSTAGLNFDFPDAERGPISQGIPGIVKQADILTPIAPILAARSDSFLIRGYGERTDPAGRVIARAWCEAVVQRSASFIDPADAPEKPYANISLLNQTFGRKFDIVSFRWLNPSEA